MLDRGVDHSMIYGRSIDPAPGGDLDQQVVRARHGRINASGSVLDEVTFPEITQECVDVGLRRGQVYSVVLG